MQVESTETFKPAPTLAQGAVETSVPVTVEDTKFRLNRPVMRDGQFECAVSTGKVLKLLARELAQDGGPFPVDTFRDGYITRVTLSEKEGPHGNRCVDVLSWGVKFLRGSNTDEIQWRVLAPGEGDAPIAVRSPKEGVSHENWGVEYGTAEMADELNTFYDSFVQGRRVGG